MESVPRQESLNQDSLFKDQLLDLLFYLSQLVDLSQVEETQLDETRKLLKSFLLPTHDEKTRQTLARLYNSLHPPQPN